MMSRPRAAKGRELSVESTPSTSCPRHRRHRRTITSTLIGSAEELIALLYSNYNEQRLSNIESKGESIRYSYRLHVSWSRPSVHTLPTSYVVC